MFLKKSHIHFVGIGGIGMSGIAKVLLESGCKVSGSDIISSNSTKLLQSLGANIYIGHKRENIRNSDLLVISSVISKNNIEVKSAIIENILIISRTEMLAYLMKDKNSIAISGTHGKTSTTAIVASIMKQGGLDPTVIVGGILDDGNNAYTGNSDFIVVEADESDGLLSKYSPTIAVVTNIDNDHLDFYRNMDAIKQTFQDFISNIPNYGTAVLCIDNKTIQHLLPNINQRILTYGLHLKADLRAINIVLDEFTSVFEVVYFGKKKGQINLNLPGIHNVYNALAAVAVGLKLGIPLKIIKTALKNVKGVKRRMELKADMNGIIVLDDYGHHPTEILSTLGTINKSWPKKRKIVVFQPHRHTRTKLLFGEFAKSFYDSDILIILPIYDAGEKYVDPLKSQDLCEAVKLNGHHSVFYADNFENCVNKLQSILSMGDILITLGAGDVYKVGELIIEKLTYA